MFSIELKYALQIVSELECARLAGKSVSATDVCRRCGREIMVFNKVMFYLNRSKWVDNGEFCPSLLVDPQGRSLLDLAEAIGDPAVNEHDYIYGWSADSLNGMSVAVDISRTLNEEYRSRLSEMPLPALMVGLNGDGRKRTAKNRSKLDRVCPGRKARTEL